MEARTVNIKLKTNPFFYCQSGISCPVENTRAISAHRNDNAVNRGGQGNSFKLILGVLVYFVSKFKTAMEANIRNMCKKFPL